MDNTNFATLTGVDQVTGHERFNASAQTTTREPEPEPADSEAGENRIETG